MLPFIPTQGLLKFVGAQLACWTIETESFGINSAISLTTSNEFQPFAARLFITILSDSADYSAHPTWVTHSNSVVCSLLWSE